MANTSHIPDSETQILHRKRWPVFFATLASLALAITAYVLTDLSQSWNVDESMRLLTIKAIGNNKFPLVDFATASIEPAWWLINLPLTELIPNTLLPMGSRIFASVWIFFTFGAWAWVLGRIVPGKWFSVWLVSIFFVSLVPNLLLKVSEFRPDAAAAFCLLTVAILTFHSKRLTGRLAGIGILAICFGMRSEMVIAILPWWLAIAIEVREKRLSRKWLLAPLVIFAFYFMELFAVTRWHMIEFVGSMVQFMAIGSVGKVSANIKIPFIWWVVLALGQFRLLMFVWHPKRQSQRTTSVFLFGIIAVTEVLYGLAGAQFLQNHWIPFCMAVPFASIAIIEFIPLLMRDLMQSVWFAGTVAMACIAGIILTTDRLAVPIPNASRSEVHLYCQQYPGNTDATSQGMWGLYKKRRVIDVVRFQTWLVSEVGQPVTWYSNDFLLTVGKPFYKNVYANFEELAQINKLSRETKDAGPLTFLQKRFPQAFFQHDGIPLAPGDFIADQKPVVLIADPTLSALAYSSKNLCQMIRKEYIFFSAPGSIDLYVRNDFSSPSKQNHQDTPLNVK